MPIKELKVELTPKFKNLKIKARRDILNKALEGNWTTIFKGQGMEFSGYRAYTYSDDASKIDWAASLRSHELLVRDLEEFHNFNIFFLLDVSDSMLFSSTGKLKAEYAAELTYSLATAIIETGDAMGLGLFTDKLVVKLPPNTGKEGYYRIVRELANPQNYGGKFDIKKVLRYIQGFLKEKSLVIIVSDFIGLEDGWNRYLNMVSGKYDIIGIMIRDPRDFKMPKSSGQFLVEDPYTGEKLYIDSGQYSKKYEQEARRQEEIVRNTFEKGKLGFISLRTDEEFQEPVLKYLRKRLALVK